MTAASVAKPYAAAIFEIAAKDGSAEKWLQTVEAGEKIMADASMQTFVRSPKISKKSKHQAIVAVLKKLLKRDLDADEARFFERLVENSRLGILREVADEIKKYQKTRDKTRAFHISSAYPLDAETQKTLTAALTKKYQTPVAITSAVDSHLLGGATIEEGDKIIDDSLEARIRTLHSTLLPNR